MVRLWSLNHGSCLISRNRSDIITVADSSLHSRLSLFFPPSLILPRILQTPITFTTAPYNLVIGGEDISYFRVLQDVRCPARGCVLRHNVASIL